MSETIMSETIMSEASGLEEPADAVPKVVLDWQQLASLLAEIRQRGKRVVTTNGVFDLLHVGHVRYLQQAQKLGDVLVVGVNSDACTRRLKGDSRPLVPQAERMEVLAALACVDYVTLFDESTPEALLAVLQPHIHVKGGDYDIERMPETPVVRRHGGQVIAISFVAGHSTSRLVERMQQIPDTGNERGE